MGVKAENSKRNLLSRIQTLAEDPLKMEMKVYIAAHQFAALL